MSKLFDAINRLENEDGQGVINSPFRSNFIEKEYVPTSENQWKGVISAAIILAIAIAGGIGSLYLAEKKPGTAKTAIYPQKTKTPNFKEKVPVARKSNIPRSNRPQRELQTDIIKALSPSRQASNQKFNSSLKPLLEAASPKTKIARLQNAEKKSGPVSTDSTAAPVTKPRQKLRLPSTSHPLSQKHKLLSARMKRLLYQAERLRRDGAARDALKLYRQIWTHTGNPLVANNLAALLIEKARYKEARDILKEALRISPSDKDLNYNLLQVEKYLQRAAKK